MCAYQRCVHTQVGRTSSRQFSRSHPKRVSPLPDRLWAARSAPTRITDSVTTVAGTPLRSAAISDADRAAIHRELDQISPDFRPGAAQMLQDAGFPARSPAITQLLPVASGQWLVRGWAANGMERVPIAVLNQHTGSTRPGMVPASWKLLAGGFGRIIVARERADGSYEVAVYELDRPAGA